ncbi:MAG TPA: chromosome segregation protein SMC [Candidatus Alectryocaccobium stercorigallinarum]|nr:chromosome segregation protein SMC [Candidatus Alectryocaccobium stercorigallinarum]
MYLKSIEMKGFKSFASKMILEFHDGVTAIVGPNGSGKSNVADAVRWVLGEQSAKQLRGGNMQDVIFAGTQSRKPIGFASVAITLDNSDRKLNIDYPEVTVTRRLYRSGESEYMINGSACRLKDIQELFYDTGIGKEGYSLIGQGQIDRILSGKPEERRELFDEAAGIVKFKRRKAATLKKLEKEEGNLVRVTDILTELTKQVVPLEKQAEKAKIYLQKRDELKERDIAVFVINEERTDGILKELREKYEDVKTELSEADSAYDLAKQECERVDESLAGMDSGINELHQKIADANAGAQQSEARIGILEEQIKSAAANKELFASQLKGYEEERSRRGDVLDGYLKESEKLEANVRECRKKADDAANALEKLKAELQEKSAQNERDKNSLIELLNLRSGIKEKSQRYITLTEQINVRQSELTARMLKLSDEKNRLRENEEKTRAAYEKICADIEKAEGEFKNTEDALLDIKRKLTETDASLDECLTEYHRQESLLESLTNLAERYEGYGGSVKKVMEQKNANPGVLGVVAEIISTKKKYETAIETALGGSLQNIVTDNESTAKYLIEYLKRGRFGRATFLPLTAIRPSEKKVMLDAEGVIGNASDLVSCDSRFKNLADMLLGRTVVVDTIDHAIAAGRKYKHQHRMVTLDGELISPGGAMTGGSYKNNANLLGRGRQIEELKLKVKESKKELDSKEALIVQLKQDRNVIRNEQSELNDRLQRLYLDKNTAEVNLQAAVEQSDSILSDSSTLDKEKNELAKQKREVGGFMDNVNAQMEESEKQECIINEKIKAGLDEIEKLSEKEREMAAEAEKTRLELSGAVQKKEFISQNIANVRSEAARIEDDIKNTRARIESEFTGAGLKEEAVKGLKDEAETFRKEAQKCSEELAAKQSEKEQLNSKYKALFARREELSETRGLLDKEAFRLESAIEKNEAEREKNISYIWEEYELIPAQIVRNEQESRSRTQLLKEISAIKAEIRELGNVNVNAIEEYKEVRERYEFLSAQHSDIVAAAENLKGIIDELDKGMRKQFAEEFAHIREEFNSVFKKLFGGGMGTLELVEDEDILEAGIRIIAQPPGKKLQNMMQLSGGEKTLTAIALLFSIQNLKPSPFCILDEIEAALDDANVDRFAKYLHRLAKNTQFIVITHRRGTMTSADRLYGITMQEKGISTMVSVDLIESGLS